MPLLTSLGLLIAMRPMFQDPSRQVSKKLDTTYTLPIHLQYLLYLPKGYGDDPAKKWPVMLFLHGAGECGSDLEKVKAHGPPKLIAQGKDFPFIVVSPQCPSTTDWWSTPPLVSLLDDLEKNYSVDKSREYLTGLSMGGYGTWALASAQPDRFAAIAPICGGGVPRLAARLAGKGIWVFHGAKDPIVDISESQQMVDGLKSMGIQVKFTVYPNAQHDSWTETYDNPALYDWFLEHKLD